MADKKYSFILEKVGNQPLMTTKILCETLGLGLAKTKGMVAQFRRHLGNAQTSLAFHSVCTKFAIPKWRYKAKSALKITNLHIPNELPTANIGGTSAE